MKLKIYNVENTTPTPKSRLPFISITSKGIFTISAQVEETLSLKEGSTVNLVQDEENPEDWFLMKSSPVMKGFALRRKNAEKNGPLIFNSSPLATAIFSSCKFSGKGATRLPVAAAPIEHPELELFAILTAALKKEVKK